MRYDREILLDVLIYHRQQGGGACYCGWFRLGASYCEHVRDVYERRITEDPQYSHDGIRRDKLIRPRGQV